METNNNENTNISETEKANENNEITTNTDSLSAEENTVNNQHQPPTQINLESSKNTLAKRPWRLGAIQVPRENGDKVWVAAVIDSNGNAVCCGDVVDIEFILKLENSYEQILNAINASSTVLNDAAEVLKDFECKKSKAFKFN